MLAGGYGTNEGTPNGPSLLHVEDPRLEYQLVVRALNHAPEELTHDRLQRLGEGIGKVVYGSKHWVVKRERPPGEVVALIILWKLLRRWAHALPFRWGDHLMKKPS